MSTGDAARRSLGPGDGPHLVLRGFQDVFRPGLRRYVVLPVILNAFLFVGVAVLGAAALESWVDRWVDALPGGAAGALRAALWVLLAAGFLLLLLPLFVIGTALVGSPFYSALAQALEARLTGRPEPSPGLRGILGEAAFSFAQETRKILYFARWGVPLLVLCLIPPVTLLAPVLWAVFGSWMGALETIDFVLAAYRIPLRVQRRLLRARLPFSFSFGATTLLLATIPLLNLAVLPAAVAGAVHAWVADLRHDPVVAEHLRRTGRGEEFRVTGPPGD